MQADPEESTGAPCRRRTRVPVTWLPALLVLGAILLHAPSINWGFLYDDYIHQAVFRYADLFPSAKPWDLYDFGAKPLPGDKIYETGLFPWWTADDFQVRFFRPVTSLSIYLDYLLYGDWSPGYHITSIALFATLLVLAYTLYRQIGIAPSAALWALAFLALEDNYTIPVGWIANRNSILGTLFIILCLLAVHRHRLASRAGHRRQSALLVALGVLSFFLACGSKESGVIALPLVGCYLFFLDTPQAQEGFFRGVVRVLKTPTLWVFVVAAAVYLGGYAVFGRGANSNLYDIPWHDPWDYLRRLSTLIPLAFSSLFFGVPSDMVFSREQLIIPIALISLVPLSLLGAAMWHHLRSNRQAGFAVGWALFSLAPVAGVTLSDRLLMTPSVGTALLLGLFLHALGPPGQLWRQRRFLPAILFSILVAINLILSIPMTFIRGNAMLRMATLDREAIVTAEIPPPNASDERSVFLVDTPSAVLGLTMLPTWMVARDDPEIHISYLQLGRRDTEWYRESATDVVVRFAKPFVPSHRYERLFHTGSSPPAEGSEFRTAHFRAEVLESGPEGITMVRFRFENRLDDPGYTFLAWQDNRLARFKPPAVGETLRIAATSPIVPYAP